MVNRDVREKARDLRAQGIAVNEIARLLNVSKGSVSIWVRDIILTEDQIEQLRKKKQRYGAQNQGGRTNYIKGYARRVEYQLAGREAAQEMRPLHMAGCLLYWAEGAKDRNRMIFANSDVNMQKLFVRFLREEMHIADEKMVIYIYCHTTDDHEHQRIQQYWCTELQLPATSIRKVLVKKGSNTRKNRLEYGVCRVAVYSVAVLHHIYGAIQEYGGFENPAWLL